MNSWPSMSPLCIVGMNPLYICRSEPQIAVDDIFTIASRWLRICGSGTSSTCIIVLPYQQLAFIAESSPLLIYSLSLFDSATCPPARVHLPPLDVQDVVPYSRCRAVSRLKPQLHRFPLPV